MASVQLSAAGDSAILPADSSPDARLAATPQIEYGAEQTTALLVVTRATAGSLQAGIPDSDRLDSGSSGVVLDVLVGPERRIRLTVVTNQRAALDRLKSAPPRAVLVEVDGKPGSRVQFCEMLRKRAPDLAIVAVGRRAPDGGFVYDGFVPLPLSVRRMARAIEQLDDMHGSGSLVCGPFELNAAARTVKTPSGEHSLTPKLCALLRLLILRCDEVVSRSEIMESIWETSYIEDTRTLDVHIRWLRLALEPDPSSPRYLMTERGIGYSLHSHPQEL